VHLQSLKNVTIHKMKTERDRLKAIWRTMIYRCENKSQACYPRYGGRGIRVCGRWKASFDDFLADMGPRPSAEHSIERCDNNGNYEPGNCRWATRLEQGANRRNNKIVHFEGRNWHVYALARHIGVPRERLAMRLWRGWTVEEAVAPAKRVRPVHWKIIRRLQALNQVRL
jgi:hypothetical protein